MSHLHVRKMRDLGSNCIPCGKLLNDWVVFVSSLVVSLTLVAS
jgi:hypothetical protein